MKTDKFFSIEIVDRFSRIFMLLFAGIILGSVFAVAFYSVFDSGICVMLVFLALYCILFTCYVAWTNSKRDVSKIEILKDRLVFVFEKQGRVSTKKEILYSDIEEYKITPGTSKKNLSLEIPEKNKFSLRIFGFRTCVTAKNGEKIEFSDSGSDGVLAYSPAYVCRIIDLKRYLGNFPLVLENFDSKMDSEDFAYQFKYYEENQKNLPIFRNKKYLFALAKYSLSIVVIAALLAFLIAYLLYTDIHDISYALLIVWITLGIIIIILAPTYIAACLTPLIGERINNSAGNKIKEVIKE